MIINPVVREKSILQDLQCLGSQPTVQRLFLFIGFLVYGRSGSLNLYLAYFRERKTEF